MVKAVALPDAIKNSQQPATMKRRWSLPRPLHMAALVVSVASMLLTLRLTAEHSDLGHLLPLFGPRRTVPRAWLLLQPVPAAFPLPLPEQAAVQPTSEQAAVAVEPVQLAAESAVQPSATLAEPSQPTTVVVNPIATDASAVAAIADAAAALHEAVTAAAATTAQLEADTAGAGADPQPSVVPSASAVTSAEGATATAGEGTAAASVDLRAGGSTALRGLRDSIGATPAPVRPQERDISGQTTATPSVTAAGQQASTAQVSTGTVWGSDPYGR